MTTHSLSTHALELRDLMACTDVAGLFALFDKLQYPMETPMAVPLEEDDLPGALRDAVHERYIVAEVAERSQSLTVTLFVLRTGVERATQVRGIAQAWTRRFAGHHLLIFTVAPSTEQGFQQITFINTRRLGEGVQVRIKLHKLIVDRANPTRHDGETLNAIAVAPRMTPQALYEAQCHAFDVERITQDFYREYARRFTLTKERILAENQAIAAFHDPQKLHTFTQRLFGRLMFLYFLQKKGALNRNPAFLLQWYRRALAENENFYRYVLEPLFFQTLNVARSAGQSPLFGQVPYLNGGLFAEDEDDYRGGVYLDNAIFDAKSNDGLLFFLNTHNFTIEEDTPLEVEVALDPEMLGKVFENLLAEAERSQSGTFYTPRAVVAFMCRESLAAYLTRVTGIVGDRLHWLLDEAETGEPIRDDQGKEVLTHKTLERPLREKIDHALDAVRVLDPAVGSGAFPLGMLALLVGVRRALFRVAGVSVAAQSDLVEGWKRNFIRDCLYGVDIKREAIEIARLRLWLSLVVDADPFQMEPLPNLDYKLMDGDSLIETFDGVVIYPTRIPLGTVQGAFGNEETEALKTRLCALQAAYFQPDSTADRTVLKAQVRETEYAIVTTELRQKDAANATRLTALIRQLTMVLGKQSEKAVKEEIERLHHDIAITKSALADLKAGTTLPFFLYGLHFASVFSEKDGFDIVIANPPYVRHQRIEQTVQATLKATYPSVHHGMADLYTYFYARALDLLHDGGTFAYITSNKFFRAGYGEKLRTMLTTATRVRTIIDFGDAPVFDAAAYPCIVIAEKGTPHANHTYRGLTATSNINIDKLATIFTTSSQIVEQVDGTRPPASSIAISSLVSKLLRMGTPLGTYVDKKIYRGVITGLNEAFVVDTATRDRLIEEDPRSIEVLKPFLRGRDVSRYHIASAGLWLIKVESGWTRTSLAAKNSLSDNDAWRHFETIYPAIAHYLLPFAKSAHERDDQGQYWWELRSCVYYAAFEQPKIIWGNLVQFSKFAFDMNSYYICAPANMLVVNAKFLLAMMNSSLMNLLLIKTCIERSGYFVEAKKVYVAKLPIVEPSLADQQRLTMLVDQLQIMREQGPTVAELESEVDAIVYRTYGLMANEIAEIERWHVERRAMLSSGRRHGKGKKEELDDINQEQNEEVDNGE